MPDDDDASEYLPAVKRGRPTVYNPEVAAIILSRLAAGETLRAICSEPGMPAQPTVSMWAARDTPPGFYDRYTRARQQGLDVLADELLAIADTPQIGTKTRTDKDGNVMVETGDMIEHRRLQVDARKWYLAKLAPKRYGDRVQVTGSEDEPVVVKRIIGVDVDSEL